VKAKSEIGFLKVIVRPLHVTLSKFLNDGLRELVENLDETIIEWEKVLAKALEEEKEL
jgi:predicted HAD superfamily phosphohydrolase YqeG